MHHFPKASVTLKHSIRQAVQTRLFFFWCQAGCGKRTPGFGRLPVQRGEAAPDELPQFLSRNQSLTIGRTSLKKKKKALIYTVHGLIKNKKDNGTKRHMMKNHSLLPHPSPDPGKHLTFSAVFLPQFHISQQHSCASISRFIYCKHY